MMVQKFLSGHTEHTVAKILECWIKSPYGRPREDNDTMFSATQKYCTISTKCSPGVTCDAYELVGQMFKTLREP